MKRPHWIAISVAVALLLAAGVLYFMRGSFEHLWHEERATVEHTTQVGPKLALEEALQIAQREVPGEVVKVEREDEQGVEVIEIKILTAKGRVREITLDAHSGQVLEIEND
jgi:uncharacterized membrane protein YkoI